MRGGALRKSVARAVLTVPWAFGLAVLLSLFALVALCEGLRAVYRRLELWAVYDGDEDARDRDEWRAK